MAINEEHRQVEIAAELEAVARALAHSTRDIRSPVDSYTLLAELTATMDHLQQICRRLAAWHTLAHDGKHYAGEDERGDGATSTGTAAAELERATAALDTASAALRSAHAANGVVRWHDEAQ